MALPLTVPALVALSALVAWPALVALSALVAWPASVALSALVAWPAFSALAALGTVPSVDSLTCLPVTVLFLRRLPEIVPFLIFEPLSNVLAAVAVPPSARRMATNERT